MRRGWLARLARADGRSLMRALAALLFVNAFVAGMHGGLAAAPGAYAADVVCHVGTDGPAPAPAAGHDGDCCLPGASPAMLALAAPAGTLPAVAAPAAPAPESQVPAAHRALTRAGPRAPPSLPA